MIKNNSTIFILLFILLFLYSKAEEIEWLYYNFASNSIKRVEANIILKKNYAIDFEVDKISQLPYYLKVQVSSTDDGPTPILCFSNQDQNFLIKNQLVINPLSKENFIWIKREEFWENDQELYIMIQCQTETCSYILEIEGSMIATLPSNIVYSYLVGNANKEMKFEVKGSESKAYMTISLNGSPNSILSLDDIDNRIISYKSGKIITFYLDENKSSSLASFTIKGTTIGDYITLSIHIVNLNSQSGLDPKNFLLPNGPEITGYLKRNIINEECFPIDLSNDTFKNVNHFYITGRIYTKYAWFFLKNENN